MRLAREEIRFEWQLLRNDNYFCLPGEIVAQILSSSPGELVGYIFSMPVGRFILPDQNLTRLGSTTFTILSSGCLRCLPENTLT
jgi:hypothetical protein